MAKSISKKFSNFKARHKLTNEDIVNLVTEYANSSLNLARTYFSSKYNLTEYVFYKARDYAIICCLVDYDLHEKIRKKSSANYKNHNKQNSSVSSVVHFEELLAKQKQFLSEFSDNEILDIGRKYAEGIPVKNLAIAYETGEFAIKQLLKKGIINLVYDADLVRQIEKIVGPSLDSILSKRKTKKDALLSCYNHEIELLNFQISFYDLYYRFETDKPSIEYLEKSRKAAIHKYNEALKL